jgi:hypothetical protein
VRKLFDDSTLLAADRVAYAALARQRGHEVMESLNSAYPGLTVLTTYGFGFQHPLYGLLRWFLLGMLEAADAGTTIHEIGEEGYHYTQPQQYSRLRETLWSYARDTTEVDPELMWKYGSGVGKWLNPQGGPGPMYQWYNNLVANDVQANYYAPALWNGNSAGWQQEVMASLMAADGYAWAYSQDEIANATNYPLHWWTGQYIPQAYIDATRAARAAVTSRAGSVVSATVVR